MTSVAITVEKRDFIAEVILRGPGKGNALGPDFWRECPEVFDALSSDPEVRAILLRGHGGTFTFGLDLRSMMGELGPLTTGEILAAERTKLLALVGELQKSADSIERCKKPVVCAIAGWCIGGGIDIAAACDVRLASKDAKLSVREVKVAMVADLGSLQRLPRIIGQGMTRELALTGDDIDANEALRIGLVNHVYEDENALLEAARAMAKRMAENPPLVVQGVKEVLNYCADKSIADGQRFVAVWNSAFLASHDLFEAIGAFSEKRPPKFAGK
jgi:enoyl-CoA hydratase